MKKLLTLFLLSLFLIPLGARAESYRIDQNKIDASFAAATEMSILSVIEAGNLQLPNQVLDDKDPAMAFILATVLGYLGIHRLYLGTEPIVVILYIITGGGCGVITLVDWIMLLMVLIDERDLGPYIDNPNFIMWKNQI